MKAYIKKDTKESDALWLIVEREDIKADRKEDSAGNIAYAIIEDEVKLIRDACNDYLKKCKN